MHDGDPVEAAGRGPRAARVGRRVERTGVGDDRERRARRPRDDLGRARRRRRPDAAAAASTTRSAIERASASRVVGRARPRAALCARTTAAGRRSRVTCSGRSLGSTRHVLRMLPSVDGRIVSASRRRCSGPGCGTACAGRSRASSTSRRTGPVILASNHISYLDPLTLAYVADAARPPRPLPRQGRAVRQARPRPAAAGARTRSRCTRGKADAAGALAAAVDALRPRRMRRGVSRRHDLAGPRADAREVGHRAARAGGRRADRSGRAVGHAPDPDEGPQAQLGVGRRGGRGRRRADRDRRAGEHVRGRDRSHHGRDHRVRRTGARDLSAATGAGRGRLVVARSGDARACTRDPRDDPARSRFGDRRGVVGDGRRRDRGRERADDVVGAPARARGADHATHENPALPARASVCPTRCTRPPRSRRRARGADVVVLGVPSHGLRAVLGEARPFIGPRVPVVSLAKGIEQGTLARMTEVACEVLAGHERGVRSACSPVRTSRARSRPVSRPRRSSRWPTPRWPRSCSSCSSRRRFRVYTNPDVVGCEMAGALKNVLAIGAGHRRRPRLRRQHQGRADDARPRRAGAPRRRDGRRPAHVRRARGHGRPHRDVQQPAEPQPPRRCRARARVARSTTSSTR